jgi:hypothetical protein
VLSSRVILAQHPRRPPASFLGLAPTSHSPSPVLLPAYRSPLTCPDPVGNGDGVLLSSSNFQPSTFDFRPPHLPKSFNCNTYNSLRKCCKQKTYVLAKPFRCNTYKKRGVGYSASLLKIAIPARSRHSRIRRGGRSESQVQFRSPRWEVGKWAELLRAYAVLSGGRERLSRSAGWKPNRV